MGLTEKEKQDLKKMMELGMLDQAGYDEMVRGADEDVDDAPTPAAMPVPPATPAPPAPAIMAAPPPEPVAEQAAWLIAVNGQQQGPFTKARLGEMLVANEITRQTLVWKKGMPAWAAIETAAELEDVLAELPPPIPDAPIVETVPSIADSTADMEKRYKEADELYNYHKVHGGEPRYDEVIPLLQALADEGYAPAQNHLGICFFKGNGVTQDYAQAFEWCRKAAEQGYAPAQNNLGNHYSTVGRGVTLDYAQAVEWYRKAAEQGNAAAQCSLGSYYSDGRGGVPQDYAQAVEWYRKAADQGSPGGWRGLGDCFRDGKGVTQDYVQAVEWYRKVAEAEKGDYGKYLAMVRLGDLFIEGQGGAPVDYAQAVEWYRKALEIGNFDRKTALVYGTLRKLKESGNTYAARAFDELKAAGLFR